jgi:hypothetical protein
MSGDWNRNVNSSGFWVLGSGFVFGVQVQSLEFGVRRFKFGVREGDTLRTQNPEQGTGTSNLEHELGTPEPRTQNWTD